MASSVHDPADRCLGINGQIHHQGRCPHLVRHLQVGAHMGRPPRAPRRRRQLVDLHKLLYCYRQRPDLHLGLSHRQGHVSYRVPTMHRLRQSSRSLLTHLELHEGRDRDLFGHLLFRLGSLPRLFYVLILDLTMSSL